MLLATAWVYLLGAGSVLSANVATGREGFGVVFLLWLLPRRQEGRREPARLTHCLFGMSGNPPAPRAGQEQHSVQWLLPVGFLFPLSGGLKTKQAQQEGDVGRESSDQPERCVPHQGM